jgi:hypothetical protein
MKRLISAIASALACTAALAQIVNPSLPGQSGQATMPGQGMPGGHQTLPAPQLLTPVADAQIRTAIANSHSQHFNWSPPRNAPAPERYVLCVVLSPSADCAGDSNASRSTTETPSMLTSYQVSLPTAFNDKVMYWTVAACGTGYGGVALNTVGNPNDRYAIARNSPGTPFRMPPPIGSVSRTICLTARLSHSPGIAVSSPLRARERRSISLRYAHRKVRAIWCGRCFHVSQAHA